MNEQIQHVNGITFGTDPEGFFAYTADGRIAGAEKVLPPCGIGPSVSARVVLDGVQFEMHPHASAHPTEVGRYLHECFAAISAQLKAKEGNFTVDFSQVVTVDETELTSLSEAARKLGCMPSFNFYRKRPIKVPDNFPVRSAAGHLHLGLGYPLFGHGMDYRVNLVPMLDLFVGIPCVLMDRDPLARERRKLYGHAGEYRFPAHGLEYRTVSNFWLKDYALFELICGLAYTACCVVGTSVMGSDRCDLEAQLARHISLRHLEGAIERNSATMAWKLWEILRAFIVKHIPGPHTSGMGHASYAFPIHALNVHQVNSFFKQCVKGRLETFVNPNPVDHWLNLFMPVPSTSIYSTQKVLASAATWPAFLERAITLIGAPCRKFA